MTEESGTHGKTSEPAVSLKSRWLQLSDANLTPQLLLDLVFVANLTISASCSS